MESARLQNGAGSLLGPLRSLPVPPAGKLSSFSLLSGAADLPDNAHRRNGLWSLRDRFRRTCGPPAISSEPGFRRRGLHLRERPHSYITVRLRGRPAGEPTPHGTRHLMGGYRRLSYANVVARGPVRPAGGSSYASIRSLVVMWPRFTHLSRLKRNTLCGGRIARLAFKGRHARTRPRTALRRAHVRPLPEGPLPFRRCVVRRLGLPRVPKRCCGL